MSFEKHDDDCPGCRPIAFDPKTMQPFKDDSPIMTAINAAWAETTLAERQAWHRVTCQNSREPLDLVLAGAINERMKKKFEQ